MDLTLDETQAEIRELARDVFRRLSTPERVAAVEASEDRLDVELWKELARTGLLGVAVADAYGGLGFGMVELALVCEELGRSVAAVPLVETAVAALSVAEAGTEQQRTQLLADAAAGRAVVAVATCGSTLGVTADGSRLTGVALGVPWAHVADRVILDVGGQLFLLDPRAPSVTTRRGTTTGGQVALDLELAGAPAEPLGDRGSARRHRLRLLTALAAVQAGVTSAAVRIAATYTSEREQFGKPLSSFQGVSLKAADAYVDATAIEAVALQAAWFLDRGSAPDLPVLTAAWWAAEAGQHCVHITQHLHGGMGADVTYPVHRYFLWGKQIELLTGGASALLAELGDTLAATADAGDSLTVG